MIPKVYDRWLARQSVVSWIYVFVGSVVLSAGFVLFMNPYRIVPGGASCCTICFRRCRSGRSA